MAGLNPLYPAPDKWRPGDNLLDNWYFVGGGSQLGWGTFPINQRGQTSTQTAGYFIDRWRYGPAQSEGSATLTDEGIELAHPGNDTGRTELAQVIANPPTGTVTASFLTSNNQLLTGTGTMGNLAVLVAGKRVINVTSTTFQIRAWYGVGFTVVAAMLEPGTEQHLAHKEGGRWVLNRVPDYGEELARCQRYYQKAEGYFAGWSSSATNFYASVPLVTPMAKSPAVSADFPSNGSVIQNGSVHKITAVAPTGAIIGNEAIVIQCTTASNMTTDTDGVLANSQITLDANP